MKNISIILVIACVLLAVHSQRVIAQLENVPLTMQGLNQTTNVSAVSRAMGGVTLSLKNDVSVMFSNPAALQTLDGIQLSVGGLLQNRTKDQTQQWFTSSSYSMFSLLMAGLTRDMPNPDSAHLAAAAAGPPPRRLNAGDSVQRPFDSIGPDWTNKKNEQTPMHAFIAAPFSIGDIKFAAGLGAVEYALANYYYQDNNILGPNFGSLRDTIMYRPVADALPLTKHINWSQVIRRRIGSIYGYGGAVSVAVNEKLFFGLSVMLLKGSTTDYERTFDRGVLYFYSTYVGLYRNIHHDTTLTGTSDFSGSEFTLSGTYQVKNFTCGIAVKPPMTITRDYSGTLQVDTVGIVLNSYAIKSTDKMKLPWRGSIGIGAMLRSNIFLGVEFEYLPNSTAVYSHDTLSSNPWLDGSSFRIGLEYLPIPELAIRAGYKTQTEVFEPEGNYNIGEPVSSVIYSCGIGLTIANIRFNVAYEYQNIQYEDKWATNYNINTDVRHNVVAGVSYTLQ